MKKSKKPPEPLDYETAKFLWAIAQMVPNNPKILAAARRNARKEPIEGWLMEAIEFIDVYEEEHGKLKRATKLPPELTNFESIPIARGVSIIRDRSSPPHSHN